MSLNLTREVMGYLVSSTSITNYVNASNIKVGWPRTLDDFPCIIINQVSGVDIGRLGYKTATAGSKMRREDASFQIDIFSEKKLETLQVADEIVKVMISGNCSKESDIDDYNDELGMYRKIQTYSKFKFWDD